MDAATATVIGVAVGGFITLLSTLLGTWLNNRHQRQQQREQWERDEWKAHQEALQRDKERAAEQEERIRQELVEVYTNAIRYLSMIYAYVEQGPEGRSSDVEKRLYEDVGELQKWLSKVVMLHYDKQSFSYQQFHAKYTYFFSNTNQLSSADDLREVVINIAAEDPRLSPSERKDAE